LMLHYYPLGVQVERDRRSPGAFPVAAIRGRHGSP